MCALVSTSRLLQLQRCSHRQSSLQPLSQLLRMLSHPLKNSKPRPPLFDNLILTIRSTKIITTTSIDAVTSTVTEKKTTTVTGWVVETTFADNDDIYYRRFNCPFNANIYDDGFTTAYFKNKNPLSSGYMQSLEFSTCSLLTLPGTGTFNPSQAALIVNAYFYAKETGTYTFSVPDTIDNWGYLWLGDAAYSRNFGSWAVRGTRTGQNANLWRGGSFPISLKKGDAIPFTYLWANGGGCAGNSLNVRLPSGLVVPGMRGSTVKACNAGMFA